ncbi:MAG: hypothetical protein JST73_10810 [Actinobacteria bacterium]|nr:hypothetical protein [Actinomycetota bacterium]
MADVRALARLDPAFPALPAFSALPVAGRAGWTPAVSTARPPAVSAVTLFC